MTFRECEECNLCCKLPEINYTKEKKEAFSWCKSCNIGKGCKVYKNRPKGCKDFYCLYQQGLTNLKPNKVGFFIFPENEQSEIDKVLTIYCEEHKLTKLSNLLLSDEDTNNLIKNGWSFHIRYNKDDNDLAIFDLERFGENIKKVKRNNYN